MAGQSRGVAGCRRKIEGLDGLSGLRELNLSYNFISKMEGMQSLEHLTELNLMENNIHQVRCVCACVQTHKHMYPTVAVSCPDRSLDLSGWCVYNCST